MPLEPAKKEGQEAKEEQGKYNCECIKCGHKMTSDKHCADLKCPKCGGQMRRAERPGPGQDKNLAAEISLASPLPLMLEYVTAKDWAMEFSTLERMSDIFERHFNGERISAEAVEKIIAVKNAEKKEREFEVTDRGVAIIPISGVIAKHVRMVNGISSPRGTSIETLRPQLNEALDDRHVRSILLHIESPGGIIDGLADFADELYQVGQQKPLITYADDICTSAAYWLGSQSQKLFANQTADVGSIGVYTLYVDTTKLAEQEGLKFYIFRSGQHKGVGSPGITITKENRKVIQERIDAKYEVFITAVLRGRNSAGLDEKSLRALADGRCYVGRSSLVNRLVDGIGSFAEAIAYAEQAEIENSASLAVNSKVKETIIMETTQDTVEETQKAAAITERQRISAISIALDGDDFKVAREKAIADGLTIEQAEAAAFDVASRVHAKQLSGLQAELDQANQRLKAIADGGADVIASEASDKHEEESTAAGKDDGKAETYDKAVKGLVDKGEPKAKAYEKAAHKFPKSHAVWVQKQPKRE